MGSISRVIPLRLYKPKFEKAHTQFLDDHFVDTEIFRQNFVKRSNSQNNRKVTNLILFLMPSTRTDKASARRSREMEILSD